jgi:hypothetical protein
VKSIENTLVRAIGEKQGINIPKSGKRIKEKR